MSHSKLNPSPEQVDHYHVDVFVGEERSYFRGLVLINNEPAGSGEGWTVVDDGGVFGERDGGFGENLPLREAIRRALALLRHALGPSISPVWGTAPYGLLGYRAPPSLFEWLKIGWFRLPLLKRSSPEPSQDRVGEDGLPTRRQLAEDLS